MIDVTKTVVVDRYWHHRIFVLNKNLSDEMLGYLRTFSLIGFETGGASGFASVITHDNFYNGKLYSFNHRDYEKLNEVFKYLETELDKLIEDELLQNAIRLYSAKSGIFAEKEKSVILYVIRMLSLSAIINGTYLSSPERLAITEAICSYYNIQTKKQLLEI